MKSIEEYDYPKQYILKEKNSKKIYKTLNGDDSAIDIEKYQWKIVTTITDSIVNNEKYTLLQCEDERIGWLNINESIQIFRFKEEIYRFLDENYEINNINEKLGIDINIDSKFTGKLLTIKSEISYENQRLVGVFNKNKFLGFHEEKYFDKLLECNFKISNEKLKEKQFYKTSKMQVEQENEFSIYEPKLVSIFSKSNIGKVKINEKEYFWIYLNGFEEITSQINKPTNHKDITQKHIDDLFYGIRREREHSKKIVKRVLSLNNYLNAKNKKDALEYDMSDNENLVKEIRTLKKEIKKMTKEINLSNTRLEHQKDYNKRLEAQKEKYKARMILLEEKIKKYSK